MTLFEECVLALGEDSRILNSEETKEIFSSMIRQFPMNEWGRIDWDNISGQHEIASSKAILGKLCKISEDLDLEVYIIWDEISLPAVNANLKKIIDAVDDVTAVSFNTWIFCPASNYVIEFYHENEIRIGWTKV